MVRKAWNEPFKLADGTLVPMHAWTGGHEKAEVARNHPRYWDWLQIVTELMTEQGQTFRAYWGDEPDQDTLEIFWSRAKADAYRSLERAGLVERGPWDAMRY